MARSKYYHFMINFTVDYFKGLMLVLISKKLKSNYFKEVYHEIIVNITVIS